MKILLQGVSSPRAKALRSYLLLALESQLRRHLAGSGHNISKLPILSITEPGLILNYYPGHI